MDQPLLLLLALAVAVAVAALAVSRRRVRSDAAAGSEESPLAVSTEGMKICPKCAMGNLWTERRCSVCGSALKG